MLIGKPEAFVADFPKTGFFFLREGRLLLTHWILCLLGGGEDLEGLELTVLLAATGAGSGFSCI